MGNNKRLGRQLSLCPYARFSNIALVGAFTLGIVLAQIIWLAPKEYSNESMKTRQGHHRESSKNHAEDGCGIVDNRHSPTWAKLSQDMKDDFGELKACLRRVGHPVYVTEIGEADLDCSVDVTLETVRSTLSKYKTVWLHGDSVMMQQFYTLACAMNPSVVVPPASDVSHHSVYKTGLGRDVMEKFSYSHSGGITEFIYSRFGAKWGLDANLYEDDFPLAVKTLTSGDAILINAAAHFDPNTASTLERAMNFIAEQSVLTNATVFYMEPHPEEWPTTNGMYTPSCHGRCKCEILTDDRIRGRGRFTQPPKDKTNDDKYSAGRGAPDGDFFGRLYPDLAFRNDTEGCTPNCLPATWWTDFVRAHLGRIGHDLHVVPVFWQIVSRNRTSGRGLGDCTHKDMYATMLMNFQWIRTIMAVNSR